MPESRVEKQKGLYRVKASELPVLASHMAKNFFFDPLFEELLPGEAPEQKFYKMERYFLMRLQKYYPVSKIYSLDKQLNCAIVIFDSAVHSPKTNSIVEVAGTVNDFIKEVGGHRSKRRLLPVFEAHRIMVKDWISDIVQGRYLHVELLFVDQSLRGKGAFKILWTPLLKFADRRELPITLETHNYENTKIYGTLGFEFISIIKSRCSELTQYCMIRD